MDARDQKDSSQKGILINECIEWSHLTRLHKQMRPHLLAVTVNIDVDEEKPRKTSHMTAMAANRWQLLNFEIRKAVTRQDLEILINLDAESSDTSLKDLQKAQLLLQDLCQGLEELVNKHIIQSEERLRESPPDPYPNLVELLTHLEKSSSEAPIYELFSTTSSFTALFVHAPIAVPDQIRSLETLITRFNQFNQFIDGLPVSAGSLGGLLSPKSSGADLLSDSSDDTRVFNSHFYQHAVTALQALFSTFSKCDQQEQTKYDAKGWGDSFRQNAVTTFQKILSASFKSDQQERTEHKVMLGLPCWKELSVGGGGSAPFIVNMLCTFCTSSSSTNWQEIQIIAPRGMEQCWTDICKAADIAAKRSAKLELYIREDAQAGKSGLIELLVPLPTYESKESIYSGKNDKIQLETLIAIEAFARETAITPKILALWRKIGRPRLFTYEDRKTLATKLLIGLLFSLESHHTIKTWDPRNIHFFAAPNGSGEEMRKFPFASCDTLNSSDQELLVLPRPDVVLTEYPLPFPAFTMLAKILLEIAVGKCDDITLVESGAVLDSDWQLLSDLIDSYTKGKYCVELPLLPIVHAAYSCLNFHTLYHSAVHKHYNSPQQEQKQDIDALTIARTVVFEEIIIKIESGMLLSNDCGTIKATTTMDKPKEDRGIRGHQEGANEITRILFPKPSDTTKDFQEIALFDDPEDVSFDSKSKEALSAKSFFMSLDQFHKTCKLDLPFEGSERIRIAIIDTGIDMDHPGIVAYYTMESHNPSSHNPFSATRCRSWVGSETDCHDKIGHGTNCAFLAAKAAPHAEIYVAKVFDCSEFKPYQAENIAKAIDWAAKQWKAHIISMSFGMHPPKNKEDMAKWLEIRKDIDEAIQRSGRRIIFAAASNSGSNKPRAYPAESPYVICMHASDGKGKNSTSLNPRPEPESVNLMTLGTGIELLEKRNDTYQKAYKSGTSFATAIASGLAANILALANSERKNSPNLLTKLKECEGMRRMLKRMSIKEADFRYIAPWVLWKTHINLQRVDIWDQIEDMFDGLA
ncbi:hypothetical protein V8C43DRAFT_300047 [Trichoderma afarasin]